MIGIWICAKYMQAFTNLIVARAVATWIAFAFVHIVFAIDADDAGNAYALVATGILVRKWFREN